MKDIDSVLGSKKYLNAVDPVSAVAEAVGKTADSFKKPDIGKYVAQRCGRKGFGYIFNKSKRDEFAKCSKEATDDYNKQYNTTATTITSGTGTQDSTKSLMEQQTSNTNKILIGLGIVVVGFLGYIAIKK